MLFKNKTFYVVPQNEIVIRVWRKIIGIYIYTLLRFYFSRSKLLLLLLLYLDKKTKRKYSFFFNK